MAKNKKPGKYIYTQLENTEKRLNKRGEIKFNKLKKSEKKIAMAECVHHRKKKKGGIVSRVVVNGDDTVTCRICGQRFETNATPKDEIKKVSKKLISVINCHKYILQASGIKDQKMMDYMCQLQVLLMNMPKFMHQIQKVFVKSKAAKRKNNNNGNDRSCSRYGTWEHR